MKLIVFAQRLELGETQTNAVELAASLRDRHGYDVILHAAPGPALEQVQAHGLRYAPAANVRFHPSPARMRALRALAWRERPDLIHAWDWKQGLEAYIGTHLGMGVPLVISDMTNSLTGALPRDVPTSFGSPEQQRLAQTQGWSKTGLLRPSIDLAANAPGMADSLQLRQIHQIAPDEVLLVSVSHHLNGVNTDPLIRAIRAVRHLGIALPLRLLIVGDDATGVQVHDMAEEANEYLGRPAVILTGPMTDPRPAYAVSDIVLGMGGSALRGLAFAKPLVVVGERGFARIFDARSAPAFLESGLFGTGEGGADNHSMADAIGKLAWNPDLRSELAAVGLDFVTRHHGLETVTDQFAMFCEKATTDVGARARTPWPLCRTAFFYLRERRFRFTPRDPFGKV